MFVHLRLHTEFSVVDSTNRIDDVVAAAKTDSQPALAITDLNNLFGTLKFYKATRGKGVKPLIGAEIIVEGLDGEAPPSRMLLLVKNRTGYLNLCELLTRAWTQNVVKDQAICKPEWLQELSDGLLALSGAQKGPLGAALLKNEMPRAERVAGALEKMFPGAFFLELQRADRADDETHVRRAVKLASKLQLPVVATHPIQFLNAEDFEAHEARICIANGERLSDPNRSKNYTPEQYFKSAEEMSELFADIPVALSNTVAIAQACNLSFVLGKSQLPEFPTPLVNGEKLDADTYFRHVSHQGLEDRLIQRFPDVEERERERQRYVDRLEFELTTIIKMGFPGYFLIVGDFIAWAKNNGCPVGPGRGSGAGSLVAYALKITDLDPLLYKLLFERFLNPDRVSMPDFDIDFCQANRDRVIDYVKDTYGKDAVSQIATFGTMAARGVVRDVGRVLELGYGFCDGISKLIPNKPGVAVTLQLPPTDGTKSDKYVYAIEAEPILADRERNEDDVANLMRLARGLEGLTRNIGMHAGGVLIAPGKLTDFCPLYQQPGSTSAVSQFDKDDVEAIGLVKFDFLGLATLTILDIAQKLIIKRHADQAKFSYDNLPLDDAKVYELFANGFTEAVFQFESRGMQAMLKEARPTRLEDLFALNAMFRPGPLENIPDFCARKNGRKEVEYPHPLLEQVLSETYGIMVYQEQVMQTAQVLGGYSLGGADLLRRAMGKKKAEEMAAHRELFRKGAAEKGIGSEKADEVFDLMEKFAGYGFNKSHAAAYSLLAYHTAWIKVYYTAEFYAANMTVEMGDTDKLYVLYKDARTMGITIEQPDINLGVASFEPTGDDRIRYGLAAVKGAGSQAIEAIVAAREGRGDGPHGHERGPFKSIFDFCRRVARKSINKRTLEALIKAGAFDTIEKNRAAMVASIGKAVEYGTATQANTQQAGLFDADPGYDDEPDLEKVKQWGGSEALLMEKGAIGFCLSGHLFTEPAVEVRQFIKTRIGDLEESKERVTIAGIIAEFRVVNGRRGRSGAFVLDDGTGRIEVSIDEGMMDANKERLKDDELLVLKGTVRFDTYNQALKFRIDEMMDLTQARCAYGKYVEIDLIGDRSEVGRILKEYPPAKRERRDGDIKVGIAVRLNFGTSEQQAGAAVKVDLGPKATFYPSDAALQEWAKSSRDGVAKIVYNLPH